MARPKQQRIDPTSVERAADRDDAGSRAAASAPARTEADGKSDASSTKSEAGAKPAPPRAKSGPTPKRPGAATSRYAKSSAPSTAPRPKSGDPRRARPVTALDWVSAARPLTLPIGVAPVLLGWAAASVTVHPFWTHWARALLCLVVAVALQIGVNFANDYSDGVRGTDARRQGPARLTASGRVRPRTVLVVAFVFFGIAAVAGLVVTIRTEHWWFLAVGAVAIVAAWFYTGGKRPYGYAGLGEIAVFLFFGPVAAVGTQYAQSGTFLMQSLVAGVATGCFGCAVLMANNLRDRELDELAGKRTLSVRIGHVASRVLYAVLMLVPFGLLVYFWLLYENVGYTLFALVSGLPAVIIVLTARTPRELVTALKLTTLTALAYALALGAALAF